MATKKVKPSVEAGHDATAYGLAVERLKLSGLDRKDLEALRCRALSPGDVQALEKSFQPLPGLQIPYLDPLQPTKLLTAWPEWPGFYRLRYLKDPQGFNQQAGQRPPRYVQPPRSGVCAYFPQTLKRGWDDVLNDPDVPLIVTEGELKAAKACREGFATIGLGGVYSFRSAKLGIPLLPELERINWVRRTVYVIYDSDLRTNEMVMAALNELAEQLMGRGALPHVVPLPDVVEDGKTGLDDFLVALGSSGLEALLEDAAQPLTLARSLHNLSKRYLYVQNPGLILAVDTKQKLAPAAFKDHHASGATAAEQIVKPNGSVSLKPVSAAAAWLKWPLRREVGALAYEPGKPELITGPTVASTRWNLWPGWGCQPAKGDISLFMGLVQHLFTGADPKDLQWFLRWCAYPLKYPGTKLFTSVVLHGIKHGTGKSLLGYTLGKIYGQNFVEIRQSDLHTNFNEWAEGKQFVLGDDVTGSDKRQDADLLKKMITQKDLRINLKYVPSYVVPDRINYLFTSNQPDAFFLEDDDRRFFVHEVTVDPLPEDFYVEYDLWLDSGGGAAVFDYLLNLDLQGFNPAARARATLAKERMISDVKSDLGLWVQRLISDPGAVLRFGGAEIKGDLFSNRRLLEIYDPLGKTKTTANGLGRELRRAGVPQLHGGRPIRTSDGQDRLYVIRNRDKWEKAKMAEIVKHVETMLASWFQR